MDATKDQSRQAGCRDSLQSLDFHQILFEEATDGVFITDPDGHYIAVNPRGALLTGYSPEELLGMSVTDLIPMEDLAVRTSHVDDPRLSRTVTSERRIRCKDGSLVTVEVSTRLLSEGNVLEIVRDVAERKQVGAASEQHARELAALRALGLAVTTSLSRERISAEAIRTIVDATQPDLAFLFLCEGERLILQNLFPPEALPRLGSIPDHRKGECLCGLAVDEGRPIFSRNTFSDPRCTFEECKRAGLRSFAALPMRSNEEVLGIIGLASETEREFEVQTHFLETLAHQVSLALANARLYEAIEAQLKEREITEAALRASELFLKQTQRVARLGGWKANPHNDYLEWTEGVYEIIEAPLDYRPGLIEGLKYYLPEYVPVLVDKLVACLDTGMPFTVEAELVTETGKRLWTEVRGLAPIIENDRSYVIGTFQDITERRLAQDALRASEEKYRMVVENVHDAIVIVQDGVIKLANPQLAMVLGCSQEELLCRPFLSLVHPEDWDLVSSIQQRRAQEGKAPGTQSFRARSQSGETLWVEMSSVLLPWEGRPASLNLLRNVTAEKKLASQLAQAQKMEAVGTLAGGIAHDFNNLLQAVQGYAELLLLKKADGDAGCAELLEICRAAKRGGELTRQLLTYSRKTESKLEPVELNRIVEGLGRLLERIIPRMIRIELHFATDLHRVNADSSQIEQILMNLAVNARDAMPEGGKILIETQNVMLCENDPRLQPDLPPGDYVVLRVTDTGRGMDHVTLKNIFDPFFTTKPIGKGTGLGLAMVYGIVKSHHGHIICDSAPGQGATFEIYLPAVEQLETAPRTSATAQRRRGGNETILFVEDDESLRELGEQLLKTHGYTVILAANGESALQFFQEHKERIDLVILDLMMPGMGGLRCLKKLLELNSRIRVVLASGYSGTWEIEQIQESGARAFIQKPYDGQRMIDLVREVLDE